MLRGKREHHDLHPIYAEDTNRQLAFPDWRGDVHRTGSRHVLHGKRRGLALCEGTA